MRRFKNHSGFTLVELLAVIIIIGLLIAVSVPSLSRITQANALSNGTRQFSDQVAMARTYALVNAQNVYMLVAYSDSRNTTLPSTYCYTAYGFCVSAISPLLQNVDPLSQVSYIDAIQYLPSGAIFSDRISNVSTQSIAFPSRTNTPVYVWCVQFNKYGQIQPLTSWPRFHLTQGYALTNGATATPTSTYQGDNQIDINPLTGKATVTKS
jgi:prepilin-type N-terminal cleavage/methylation domain-containing protein